MSKYVIKSYNFKTNSYLELGAYNNWKEAIERLKKVTNEYQIVYLEIRTDKEGLV
nr:MAG TPA: hypothetical protein [Caudoviricetes sp.]